MRFLAFCLLALFLLPAAAAAQDAKPVRIVASFSILGDMIRQVGGDLVVVDVLVGPDQDAHDFQPTPQDAAMLAQADIIAINGLKFENFLGRMIKSSGTKAKMLVATAGIKPLLLDPPDKNAPSSLEVMPDPHAWQNLGNAEIYIKNIAAALIEARPEATAVIKVRALDYIAKCKQIDTKARAAFSALPASKRSVISSHDAFGYLAAAYGLSFSAPLHGEETQPNAAVVAQLIDQIKRENVQAVFIENMTDPRLIRQIADETGAHLGGTLYADALSASDGPAPTYLDMMMHNVNTLLDALR